MTDATKRNLYGAAILGALVAGQGIYWFISGGDQLAPSTIRKLLVVAQIVLGLGLWGWAGLKMKRASAA